MDRTTAYALALTIVATGWIAGGHRAAAQAKPASSLEGAWTLNKDLSDQASDGSGASDDRGDRRSGRRGGGGGFGGGGFGGGRRRGGGFGGGGGGRGDVDPEQMARMRSALRDITNTPEHVTIVQTDSMIIVTGQDGRTTRLSPDGKKVKDDSTKLERKTKWDGPTLVSEVSGVPGMKITESYSVDQERRQLHVSVKSDNDRRPLAINRVYDADPK
jgi:hypothetical protein